MLKDTYDYSFCLARSVEYNHLMTDSPWARRARRGAGDVRPGAAQGAEPDVVAVESTDRTGGFR